jgi:predicted RNA-binding Zn-ribbon protein involved in translation (DUF1610 family)
MAFLTKADKAKVFRCELCYHKFIVDKNDKEFICPGCGRVYAYEGDNVIVKQEPDIKGKKEAKKEILIEKIEEPEIEIEDDILDLGFYEEEEKEEEEKEEEK